MNHAAWRLIAPALLAALAGCASSPDPVEPPAPLSAIETTLQVNPLWHTQLGGGAGGQYLALAPSGDGAYVYASTRHGLVRAFVTQSGARVWSNDLQVELGTGPAEAGDLLLLGGNAEVIALDRTSGKLRWRAPVSSEVIAAPVRAGEVIVARTVDGSLHGLAVKDGRRLWRNSDEQVPLLSLRGEGKPVAAGDAVFAGFANGRVAAFALSDGKMLWETPIAVPRGRTELERLSDVDGRLIVTPHAVFAVAFQGRIAALSPRSGETIWSRELSSYQGVAAAGSELYVSDAEGNVWALAQSSGATLWRQTALRGRALGTPVVQGSAVVVGDYDGYLHWLTREEGRFAARARVQNFLEAFPVPADYDQLPSSLPDRRAMLAPALVGKDLLVAMDERGAITAFRVTEKGAKP